MGDKLSLILVTGATGAVGPRVVEALSDAGYAIRTLSLNPAPPGPWPRGIEMRLGDITDPNVVHSAMQGVDAVVHLAALLHISNPADELRHQFERINVGGTAAIVEASLKANVKRVVFFSTIAVYGDSHGRVLDEASPPQPKTFYEQTKLDAERIILNAKDTSGLPIGAVLRLAAVYGSRIKGNYRQLLKALAKGRFIPIGKGLNRRTLVYDKDVARAAVLALRHPDAAGKVFNVSDGKFHCMKNIIASMCNALGKCVPRFSLPVRPVRMAAGAIEDVTHIFGRKAAIQRATIDKYTEDMAVDCQRIQNDLKFTPKFDLATGWTETVLEMRLLGEL